MAIKQSINQEKARQFAVKTVRKLQSGGFIAYWAGGCVRDQRLQRDPTDYDIATNALPAEIQKLFGERKTIAIGAAFGVITLIGTKSTGNIDIATFREDVSYSDGRHPDSICFSNAEQDAQRRDFTINGMFFDPIVEQTIDYVNGLTDIAAKTIRAIGDPAERFDEDKLRILRAIRFATTLQFNIEPATLAAVKQMAENLQQVSRDRILVELNLTLSSPHQQTGLNLLLETGVLEYALPGIQPPASNQDDRWQTLLAVTSQCNPDWFASTLALLYKTLAAHASVADIQANLKEMKLSNDDIATVRWLLLNLETLILADQNPWPDIQRLLITPQATQAVRIARVWATTQNMPIHGVELCEQKLSLPEAELNPPALLDGKDLQEMGMHPGPAFSKVLLALRDAQLLGEINTPQAASERAIEIHNQLSSHSE